MDKDKIKNSEIDAQIISKEDLDHHNSRGVYMRDDHCDWGSSGLDQLINHRQLFSFHLQLMLGS